MLSGKKSSFNNPNNPNKTISNYTTTNQNDSRFMTFQKELKSDTKKLSIETENSEKQKLKIKLLDDYSSTLKKEDNTNQLDDKLISTNKKFN